MKASSASSRGNCARSISVTTSSALTPRLSASVQYGLQARQEHARWCSRLQCTDPADLRGSLRGRRSLLDTVRAVSEVRAVLLDVYDTTVAFDFALQTKELAKLARVDPEVWTRQWDQMWATSGEALTDGGISLADAFAAVLEGCGTPAVPSLVTALVDADGHRLSAGCRVFSDATRLLERMRDRNKLTAMVSNCQAGTRAMLERTGLLELVDAAILSCEVHAAKPSPSIFQHALRALGVSANDAVFVDDQDAYCQGAEAVWIRAVQIARDAPMPIVRRPVVSSLDELDDLLWPSDKG